LSLPSGADRLRGLMLYPYAVSGTWLLYLAGAALYWFHDV
jgi:hypothetical protein